MKKDEDRYGNWLQSLDMDAEDFVPRKAVDLKAQFNPVDQDQIFDNVALQTFKMYFKLETGTVTCEAGVDFKGCTLR